MIISQIVFGLKDKTFTNCVIAIERVNNINAGVTTIMVT